jgi:hypothetical protein
VVVFVSKGAEGVTALIGREAVSKYYLDGVECERRRVFAVSGRFASRYEKIEAALAREVTRRVDGERLVDQLDRGLIMLTETGPTSRERIPHENARARDQGAVRVSLAGGARANAHRFDRADRLMRERPVDRERSGGPRLIVSPAPSITERGLRARAT